jgi:DNA polymerase-3 subunit epsilon
MFRGDRQEVLYVGKATNLRQRVRSYFGSDDRRKVAPMLRELQSVDHLVLPDPLTAEIVEQRLIARWRPRYNRRGTRLDAYCYVRLDTDSAWPRLSIVKRPSPTGEQLGPLPSRRMAEQVVDALHTAIPIRRCTARLARTFRPAAGATPCSAAQLGVAHCPCAGTVGAGEYGAVVELARRALRGDDAVVVERLRQRMATQAMQHRFEEAALTRDRLAAWLTATHRRRLVEALRNARRAEIRLGGSTWLVDHAVLLDATKRGEVARSLPVDPPPGIGDDGIVPAAHVEESLCLARFFAARADRLEVSCTGRWEFPLPAAPTLSRLDEPRADPIDGEHLAVAGPR